MKKDLSVQTIIRCQFVWHLIFTTVYYLQMEKEKNPPSQASKVPFHREWGGRGEAFYFFFAFYF